MVIKLKRFNTQPPEGGCNTNTKIKYSILMFQHTAARRRLPILIFCTGIFTGGFNTQPPEGGCVYWDFVAYDDDGFNTQPPEGGCSLHKKVRKIS